MSGRTSDLQLGETMPGTDANGNLINGSRLGEIREFFTSRSSSPKVAVLLRNTAGFALRPKRVARCYASAGSKLVTESDGYATTLAEGPCVFVDDLLPAAGVADDDIFWGIIQGETLALAPLSGAAFNDTEIAVGDSIVTATGSTAGATTSGRIAGYALANATDAAGAYSQARNSLGRALSARTSGETAADVLIYANIKW